MKEHSWQASKSLQGRCGGQAEGLQLPLVFRAKKAIDEA